MEDLRNQSSIGVKRVQSNAQAKNKLLQELLTLESRDSGEVIGDKKMQKMKNQMLQANARRMENNHRMNKFLQENTDFTVHEFDAILVNELKMQKEFPDSSIKARSGALLRNIRGRGRRSSDATDVSGSVVSSAHSDASEGKRRASKRQGMALQFSKSPAVGIPARRGRRGTIGDLDLTVDSKGRDAFFAEARAAAVDDNEVKSARSAGSSNAAIRTFVERNKDKPVIEEEEVALDVISADGGDEEAKEVAIEMHPMGETLSVPKFDTSLKSKINPNLSDEEIDLVGKGLTTDEAKQIVKSRHDKDLQSATEELLTESTKDGSIVTNESVWWTSSKHLPQNENERLEYASALILDAIVGRSLKERRLGSFPLFLYRMQSHPVYVRLFLIVVTLHNIMLLVEPPSFFKMGTIDIDYELYIDLDHLLYEYRFGTYLFYLPLRFIVGIEAIFVAYYVAHSCVILYSLGIRDFIVRPWQILTISITVLMVIDVLVALTLGSPLIFVGIHNPIRFSRILRPILFVIHYRTLRRSVITVVKTFPLVIDVLFIITIFMVMYAIIGMQLFMEDYEGDNFKDFPNAMLSLLVLLTTENYPSVMYPALPGAGYFSVIYFVLFIAIGTLILLNVLSAVLFDSYLLQHQKQVIKERIKERRTLLAAFACIDSENKGIIDFSTWKKLCHYLRGNLGMKNPELLFYALDDDGNGYIDTLEFFEVVEVIHMKFILASAKKYDIFEYFPNIFSRFTKAIYFKKMRRVMARIVNSRLYNATVFVLILANTALLCVHYRGIDKHQEVVTSLNLFDFGFQIVLMAEIIFRICALGPRKFLKSGWNIFDLVITGVSMVATLGNIFLFKELGRSSFILSIRLLRLLRTMRSIRLFSTSKRFRILTSTIITLFPIFLNLMLLEMLVFYSFSVLGMELFEGVYEGVENPPQETFDSVFRSFLTLFQMFTTSNWHEPMYSIMDRTYFISCLYFVIFEYLAAIILMNILLAVTLEIFTMQREMKMMDTDDDGNVPELEVEEDADVYMDDAQEHGDNESGGSSSDGGDGSGSDSGQSGKDDSNVFIFQRKKKWYQDLVRDNMDHIREQEVEKLDKLTPIHLDKLLESRSSAANIDHKSKANWGKIKKFALSDTKVLKEKMNAEGEESEDGEKDEKEGEKEEVVKFDLPSENTQTHQNEDSTSEKRRTDSVDQLDELSGEVLEEIKPKTEREAKLYSVASIARNKKIDRNSMSFSSLVVAKARQELVEAKTNEDDNEDKSSNENVIKEEASNENE